MRPTYDAIVLGTGFGGAVSACRLAQAGLSVAVFERGRRYDRDTSFPRDFNNLGAGWLWQDKQGLFDVKEISEMTIVQSAGYGGGSLIYANVHLRPPPDAFAQGWPIGYGRELLDPYYDLVGYMLDIKPITAENPKKIPPKTWMMRDVAGQLDRSAQFLYPNLAVNFGDPDRETPNKFGVAQKGCSHCGECDIGCANRAKNTLDLNYLALAERSSNTAIYTQTEAIKIEPAGTGYRVHFIRHDTGERGVAQAGAVFVCCGAVNSTELLLRCRDQYGSLPALSEALGCKYSGNGDYLAFAFDTQKRFEPANGPTITTAIVYAGADAGERQWFIFEEGGHPRQISNLLQLLNPNKLRQPLAPIGVLKEQLAEELRQRARLAQSSFSEDGKSAVFLAMGRDKSNGRIELLPLTNLLRIRWDTASNMGLYSAEERFSNDIARALGGELGYNPFWKLLRQPVSVHNLGGCAMADDPSVGVTDPHGEVFGYPNLFVLDGACLPEATGVNPSHTIAAVAERNIEHYIRRRTGQTAWMAPERALAKPIHDPLMDIVIPAKGTRPPDTQTLGICFTERMTGFLSSDFPLPPSFLIACADPEWATTSDPNGQRLAVFREAADAAKAQGDPTRVAFTLTISFPDMDAFLADRAHAGNASGTLRYGPLTGADDVSVPQGVFNLFVPTDSFYVRRMLYALPFFGADGAPYLLDGFKDVRDHGEIDVWGATSTLYTLIRKGHERNGPVVAAGIMRIQVQDFAHQMTTFRTIGPGSPAKRAAAVAQFGKLFAGTLVDVFVRPRLE